MLALALAQALAIEAHTPVLTTADAPASPQARSPHDLRRFESDVLPRWLDAFRAAAVSPQNEYAYSFFPHDNATNSLYGTTDVLNMRYLTNTLNLTAAQQDAWAAHINSFQNASGFFDTLLEEHLAGFQPWHATGYATSALLLIDRDSRVANTYYEAIARNRSSWEPTFVPLVQGPYPVPGADCGSVHACAHKLVAIPAVLVMSKHVAPAIVQPFVDWWFSMMGAHVDSATGEWCPPVQKASGVQPCLGAGMAGHALYNAARRPWPNVQAVQSFALGLQGANVTGLWAPELGNWLNLDGIFQAARAANATGSGLQTDVRAACDAFLSVATPVLTNASAVFNPITGLAMDSHVLPGVVTAIAECAKWFPDMVVTLRPWRQGVDKGPYP